jgi:TonB family protein
VDLVFGDYSETRITIGDRKYIPKGKELLNYTGISTLDEMWDPGQQPRYPTVPVYEFGKVKKSRVSGRPAWCFDKIWPHGKDRLCFDAASSLLISQKSSDSDHDEYLDYTATGEHWFPQLVKARKHALAALEVRDISISAGTIEDRLFAVPPDAIEVQACKKDIVPPKPISTPEPEFPASAGRETINVVLSAIVNKEGRLEEIAVLNPRADGLDANVMAVVSHWAFKPATCGGQPVNSEMSLEVEFKRF